MSQSYHILYFPFIVKKGQDIVDLSKVINTDKKEEQPWRDLWCRIIYKDNADGDQEEYEGYIKGKEYYHSFVQSALFDNGGRLYDYEFTEIKETDTHVCQYKRKDISKGKTKFAISKGTDIDYKLDVDKIVLNCYFTNVCILEIHLCNTLYADSQDILNINDYVRQLYLNNFNKDVTCCIEGVKHNAIQTDETPRIGLVLKKYLKQLLDDFFCDSTVEYMHMFDNKMYLNCCYTNEELSNSMKGISYTDLSNNLFWENFVEVDSSGDYGCQNADMRLSLTKKNSYLRWQDKGTLHGITDRSFVCLTSWFGAEEIMKTVYSQMVKLVLIQRTSLLSFSSELSALNINANRSETAKTISKIYCKYMIYLAKLCFKDITSQVQGVELYDMFYKTFNIESHAKSFENQLSKTDGYFSSLEESEKKNNQNNFFNILAGIFLPVTLITSILGANEIFTFNKEDRILMIGETELTLYGSQYILHDLSVVLLVSIVFWFIMWHLSKTIQNIVAENKKFTSWIFLATVAAIIICAICSIGL